MRVWLSGLVEATHTGTTITATEYSDAAHKQNRHQRTWPCRAWYKERHNNCLRTATPTRYSFMKCSDSHTLVHALRHRHITAKRERAAALTHDPGRESR